MKTAKYISSGGEIRLRPRLAHIGLMAILAGAACAQGAEPLPAQVIAAPPAPGLAAGLADSAGLRSTVFGTPPKDMAPMPTRVPLSEINIALS